MKDFDNSLKSGNKYVNLTELLDKVFVINSFKFSSGGQYLKAVLKTDLGEFSTTSKVLIDQLDRMRPYIDVEPMRVKLMKVKTYFTFTAPEEGQ